jgi:2Fe-2S ferredoxin
MTITITAHDRLGAIHSLQAEEGDTVMATLRDAGLPIEAACGGCCSCATCHVYVDPAWQAATGERSGEEDELLQMSEHLDDSRSRLGCQITLTPAHDGLVVTIAPEE